MDAIKVFLESAKIKYRNDESGSKLTTLATGGPLKFLIEPANATEAKNLIHFFKSEDICHYILGAGSNLIISDDGLLAPVVRLGRGFREYRVLKESENSVLLEVGGSMPLMTLSRELSEKGYGGLEFAGGIPATLGGAVRMNAGAHGGEMSGILREIVFVDLAGELQRVKASELTFSYRHCSLPEGSLVLGAVLELKKGDPAIIAEKRKVHLEYRKKTQPLTQPSFGSVFKNPSPSESAGMLIEKAGLRGYSIGGAQVSEMHANWIVNLERTARSSEVLELISFVKDAVKAQLGQCLHEEVVVFKA